MSVSTLLLMSGAAGCGLQREAAPLAPPVYVALGASDAVGVGTSNMARDAWPAVVHTGLPAGTQLLNLGISGATLGDVLRSEVLPALDARPRWVSLWPGVNDLRMNVPLQTFTRQLDQILGHFSQSKTAGDPRPTLIVLNIPDMRPLPALAMINPALLDRTVREWNMAIAEVAARHGAMLVDLYGYGQELASHPEYISADGFHPSAAGYRRIAELVLATLNQHVSS
jgi:lysophospholipase L1-like esterase